MDERSDGVFFVWLGVAEGERGGRRAVGSMWFFAERERGSSMVSMSGYSLLPAVSCSYPCS